MSLTGWFRDYLYIPLGGSKKGRLRKYRNIMIVFLVSGLWHGAGWKYVIWGGLNGFYQVAGELLKPLREKTIGRVWHGRAAGLRKAGSCVCTFFLVDFAWLFFRADSTGKALGMCKRLLGGFHFSALAGGALFGFGLNQTIELDDGICVHASDDRIAVCSGFASSQRQACSGVGAGMALGVWQLSVCRSADDGSYFWHIWS